MAFLRKAGSILRQTLNKQPVGHEISASKPSILQMIRFMSSSKVFVGGLSYGTDETGLREAFDKYGDVADARVITDRDTGRSRGFGFVTYSSPEEASAAIQALDGQELQGRRIRVNYANDRPRTFGGGGGFGGGYGGGGGGYGGGGGNYNSGYGGNTGGGYDGGNYGAGGYGSGGSGGGYGGNTGDSYGSEGNYAGGASGAQSYGVPAEGSTGDNFVGGGGANNFSSAELYGAEAAQGGADQPGNMNADGFVNQVGAMEENFRDDDEPEDYANRKG